MLKQVLSEKDKEQIKYDTVQKFDSLCTKLSSKNTLNVENVSEFDDDSEMSEIFVEDEVDCSEFVKSEHEPMKTLISENSIEYVRIYENGSKTLKEKSIVFPMVQTVPNQVFATTGLNKNQTIELTSLVEEDNVNGCDEYFWSAPINNADET